MTQQTQYCAWCITPLRNIAQKAQRDARSYCSHGCATAHFRNGYIGTKALVEARRARAGKGPKGCRTIEEWLARGGTIYREEEVRG